MRARLFNSLLIGGIDMLLRRITKHVKDQNWTAVALDFFIVVVGVFIGIQVANWNEARNDHQAYHEAHDRMVSEVRRNIANLNDGIDRVLPVFAKFQQATEDLRLCHTDDEAQDRISDALNILDLTLSPSFEVNAINTLTTSERLLEQQSENHRRLYVDYASFLNTRRIWSETESTGLNDRVGVFHPFLSVDAPDSGPEWISEMTSRPSNSNRKTILVAPIDDACKDNELLQMFFEWEKSTDYQINLMREVVSRSESFLEALGIAAEDEEIE